MRREAKRPLLVDTGIFVFLSIFTKGQASSPFEEINSAHLSMCQNRGGADAEGGACAGEVAA